MDNTTGAMFELLHANENIGRSRLESGDPATQTVSGIFYNVGGAKALAGWIKSIGGAEEAGAVHISMDKDFQLLTSDGQAVPFAQVTLISVPDEDETFVEISGIPDLDYVTHFTGHVAALSADAE